MKSRHILLILSILACIMINAYAGPQPIIVEPAGMDLSLGDMQISDPEHTAKYMEMTGGTARPGIEGYNRELAGNWSLELVDLRSRSVGDIDLRLFQSDAAIYGKGVFKEGLSQQLATAEGSLLEGNAMILNIVSLENVFLYRLTLNSADGNNTSGTFSLYKPSGESPVKGTVSGSRSDARKIS